mgnify:CR=1 FL=1
MLRVVLVDDEIAAIRSLELLIEQFCSDIQVVGTARSVQEAIQQIDSQKPDLVFLDIQMPHGSGFDLLEHIPNYNFEIIFITAYNQYAIKAFKYSAVDYILKPIDIDELLSAIEKARNMLKKKTSSRARYSALFENLRGLLPNKIVIPQENSFLTIDLSLVSTIEFNSKGATFHMADSNTVSCSICNENIPELIQEKGFVEIQPKLFLNLMKVVKVDKVGKGNVILENGKSITLEHISKEEFIEILSQRSSNKK